MFYLVAIAQIILLSLTSILLIRLYRLSQSGKLNQDSTAVAMGFTDILTDVLPPIVGGKREGVRSKKAHNQTSNISLPQKTINSSNRIDGFAKAQIFAGLQMLDLKQKGVCLKKHKSDWLIHSIVAYFHGAAAQIVHYFDCSDEDREDILAFLITRNLNLPFDEASKLTSQKYLSLEEDFDNILASGKAAAKIWLEKRSVPAKNSLFSSINEYGFII